MSKRVRGFLVATFGLAALIMLTLALVAILGAQGGVPVAQGPYPAGTPQPSLVRVIESPPAPTPWATAIPGAYPPGLRPTITPWPSPTPWPTPVPPPPPKPVGLQIVWAEAVDIEPGPWQCVFYLADVGDIGNRKTLYTSSPCVGFYASLSPDRSTVAFTTYSNVHFWQSGVLQVLPLDGSQPRELVRGVDTGRPLWSRDSHMLVYVKYVSRQSPPPEKESPLDRPELHVITTDGKEDRVLIAEDDLRIEPLGWLSGGRILCALSKPDLERGLWAVNAITGTREFIIALAGRENPHLSPDGQRLLIQTAGGADWLSVDGRERRTVAFAGVSTTMPTPNVPLYSPEFATVTADVYWASATEVIFRTGLTTWRIGNLDTGAVRDITVAPTLRPSDEDQLLSVSPGVSWLAVQNYPKDGFHLLKANSRVRIQAAERNAYFVGWLPIASGGE